MGEADWRTTACILCECNCGLQVQLGGDDGRRFVRLRGDKDHAVSRGYACEKAHRLDYYQNGPHRLTRPLRRTPNGTFEEIDWDTAITEVAARLRALPGSAILYYGGGGQGNHLPGTYASATRRALGSRYRSNALAQEKTGEFWVSDRMMGGYTRGDFEHCEVAVFIGKNPWHSHSIPRARVALKAIARDPNRTMIVVDPRRSETAAMADIHLQVAPGGDAWLLAAMLKVLVDEDFTDGAFVQEHTEGIEAVRAAVTDIDVAAYCRRAGVDEGLVRRAARVIGKAASVASFEDLGVQMNHHSTLVSYLHRLIWITTGNFGKTGTQYIPAPLVDLGGFGTKERRTPVTQSRIIGGLLPCNVIPDEILSESPDRFRAMIVEAANPAHSLADSKRMREAMQALDTLVVIDVALTETARLADYVLPASTQYEKAEATFFNFEFPRNAFHLRAPILAPPDGPLPEAEIHARLLEALGAMTEADLAPLRKAAAKGRQAYGLAFLRHVVPDPRRMGIAPALLYRTLGPTLPEGLAEGAVVWAIAQRYAMANPKSLARAGFDGPPVQAASALFDRILAANSAVEFAVDEWSECFTRLKGGKFQLALPDLLAELTKLEATERADDPDFPFILSAGERRSLTANTIVRNPAWRNKPLQHALRLSPADAERLGVADGDDIRLTTKRGSVVVPVAVTDMMQPGHISLPNGLGTDYPGNDTDAGTAPNELTASEDRDPFAGTPWHKHVPARLELT